MSPQNCKQQATVAYRLRIQQVLILPIAEHHNVTNIYSKNPNGQSKNLSIYLINDYWFCNNSNDNIRNIILFFK